LRKSWLETVVLFFRSRESARKGGYKKGGRKYIAPEKRARETVVMGGGKFCRW